MVLVWVNTRTKERQGQIICLLREFSEGGEDTVVSTLTK
jgi:hypothetical protein